MRGESTDSQEEQDLEDTRIMTRTNKNTLFRQKKQCHYVDVHFYQKKFRFARLKIHKRNRSVNLKTYFSTFFPSESIIENHSFFVKIFFENYWTFSFIRRLHLLQCVKDLWTYETCINSYKNFNFTKH